MYGFIINGCAIVFGASIGLLFRKVIKRNICDAVLKVVGVVVGIFGIYGIIQSMVAVNESGHLTTSDELMILLIVTLALGTAIGEAIKIDTGLNRFGRYIQNRFVHNTNENNMFAEGFINSSLVFCVGAMAIFGSIQAATGDLTTIYLKSIIDLVTAIVLASTLGFGVAFSSIVVIVYQGLITLLGYLLGNFLTEEFINAFSMVGYAMVLCIGINFIIKEKIKVANMLPSLLLVIIYYLIKLLIF